MTAVPLPRTEQRRGFQVPVRVQLLEHDVDELESTSEERHKDITERLDKYNARLLGVLCSLVVAVIMLALNLAVK